MIRTASSVFLTVFVMALWLIVPTAGAGEVVYDNTANIFLLDGSFGSEIGDEIRLGGTGRVITRLVVGLGISSPGTCDIQCRIYAADGYGNITPGTPLWESELRDDVPLDPEQQILELTFAVPDVGVSNDALTWTMELTDPQGTSEINFLDCNPPTIGSSDGYVWWNEPPWGKWWFSLDPTANLYARVEARADCNSNGVPDEWELGGGLAAHWRLDEWAGPNALEEVAGNDGLLVNFDPADAWTGGVDGNALEFDGQNDHVTHGFSLSEKGTIAHWLRPAQIRAMVAYYESSSTGSRANGFGDPLAVREIHTSLGSTGDYFFLYQDGPESGQVKLRGPMAVVDKWAHVAVTWDTDGEFIMYVDGNEVDRVTTNGLAFQGIAPTYRAFGRVGNGYADRHWSGRIDDVRVYDRVLTAEEVGRLADMLPFDCNDNNVPDECEPDCNSNGMADECEIGNTTRAYVQDSGTADGAWGSMGSFDIIAMNHFTIVEGGEIIDTLDVAWGEVPIGRATTLYLWSDPNGDGDPSDGQVLAFREGTVTVPNTVFPTTPNFDTYDLPATFVGEPGTSFFAGYLYRATDADPLHSEYPVVVDDQGGVVGEVSWWSPVLCTQWADPYDLANMGMCPVGEHTWGGTIMIRVGGRPRNEDCNANGVPDDCDIQGGTAADCNANGSPDACDIAAGSATDCNLNGVPDTCDIAFGPSTDANGNGIPDECSVRFVDDDAPYVGNGLSWERPFHRLQDALDEAETDGTIEEIRVAQGTYRPTKESVVGDWRTKTFRLSNGRALRGGYRGCPGGACIGVPNDCDVRAFETILSGDTFRTDGTCGDNSENAYHVVTATGTDATAVLDGFTITAGNANSNGANQHGAGLYNGSPEVSDCTFFGNHAVGAGGGVFTFSGAPRLTNCRFFGNSATWGGGLYNNQGAPELVNCLFSGNTSTSVGGAIRNVNGSMDVVNCTFAGNASDSWGGAIVNDGTLHVTNSVLWGNTSSDGSQISGAATVTYSCIEGGLDGIGNLDADPRFVDSNGPDDMAGTPDDDLHLLSGSPCINAGDPAFVNTSGLTDIDGEARSRHCRVDMGVDETTYIGPDCNLNSVADACDIVGGSSTDANTNGVPDECESLGACCLPEGTCLLLEEVDCASTSGIFQGAATSCDPNPCPAGPANDVCADVIPQPLGIGEQLVFTGDSTGATNECPWEWPQVWHAFSTTECSRVTIDYCGSPASPSALFIVGTCPCDDRLWFSGEDWELCGDDNVTMWWDKVPAGDYWCPVTATIPGPYILTVEASDVGIGMDLDADCDVDIADATLFVNCLTGPGGLCAQECIPGDTDADDDVDLKDFAQLQINFSTQ